MTYVKHILFAAMMTILMASCAPKSIPQRLDNFVDEAELNASSYSNEDWKKSAAEYQQLVDEYTYSNVDYTEAEKEIAARAMGRYHALVLKHSIEKGASFLREFGSMLPEYLGGLASGLDENADGIGSVLDNIFNGDKLEKSLESLSNVIDGLFEDLE